MRNSSKYAIPDSCRCRTLIARKMKKKIMVSRVPIEILGLVNSQTPIISLRMTQTKKQGPNKMLQNSDYMERFRLVVEDRGTTIELIWSLSFVKQFNKRQQMPVIFPSTMLLLYFSQRGKMLGSTWLVKGFCSGVQIGEISSHCKFVFMAQADILYYALLCW